MLWNLDHLILYSWMTYSYYKLLEKNSWINGHRLFDYQTFAVTYEYHINYLTYTSYHDSKYGFSQHD